MTSLLASTSHTLNAAYHPVFATGRKYALPQLPNLMLCYRYFKELRNAQVHAGGTADQKAVDAYTAFLPVSGKAQLGRKGELEIHPVVLGQTVSLSLRGVVGFTDVLIRIISTIDAELCRAEKAESLFEQALRRAGRRDTLSADIRKRNAQVKTRCVAAGYPPPADPGAVHAFMLAKRLIVM